MYLLLSTTASESATKLYNVLKECGVDPVSNSIGRTNVKALFNAIKTTRKVYVIVPDVFNPEEDDLFLELLDAAYLNNKEIISVFTENQEIPTELILYLARRDSVDLMELCNDLSLGEGTDRPGMSSETESAVSPDICDSSESSFQDDLKVARDAVDSNVPIPENLIEIFIPELQKMAESGIEEAYGLLAECFYEGITTDPDFEKASYYASIGAKHNDGRALLVLAELWSQGLFEEQNIVSGEANYYSVDSDKTFKYLKESAAHANIKARAYLCRLYRFGELTIGSVSLTAPKDKKRAFNLIADADESNCADAIFLKGTMVFFAIGTGTDRDPSYAVELWHKAAILGHAEAMACLGECLLGGTGCEKSEDDGLYWSKKAAEKGIVTAQYTVGLYYYRHENDSEASIWLKMAADQGYEKALKLYKEINPSLGNKVAKKFLDFLNEHY